MLGKPYCSEHWFMLPREERQDLSTTEARLDKVSFKKYRGKWKDNAENIIQVREERNGKRDAKLLADFNRRQEEIKRATAQSQQTAVEPDQGDRRTTQAPIGDAGEDANGTPDVAGTESPVSDSAEPATDKPKSSHKRHRRSAEES